MKLKDIIYVTFLKLKTKILFNLGSPKNAFNCHFFEISGIGLAREEFIINNFIGIHPLAIINHEKLEDITLKNTISKNISGFKWQKFFY